VVKDLSTTAAVVVILPPNDHFEHMRCRRQRDQHVHSVSRGEEIRTPTDRKVHAADGFRTLLQPGDKRPVVGGSGDEVLVNGWDFATLPPE
jgi:hypothetical protein